MEIFDDGIELPFDVGLTPEIFGGESKRTNQIVLLPQLLAIYMIQHARSFGIVEIRRSSSLW